MSKDDSLNQSSHNSQLTSIDLMRQILTNFEGQLVPIIELIIKGDSSALLVALTVLKGPQTGR